MPDIEYDYNKGAQGAHYTQQFYSPEKVRLYIGPVWIDDCIEFEYNNMNTKAHYYNNMAMYFNLIGVGQCMVQGQFSIVYKEEDHILNAVKAFTSSQSYQEKQYSLVTRILEIETEKKAYGFDNMNMSNPIVGFDSAGDPHIASMSYNVVMSQTDAAMQEEKINAILNDTAFSEADNIFNLPLFDIYMIYGNPNSTTETSTVNVISNVSLLGVSKSVNLEANVIETYTFIGRVLDKSFNYSMMFDASDKASTAALDERYSQGANIGNGVADDLRREEDSHEDSNQPTTTEIQYFRRKFDQEFEVPVIGFAYTTIPKDELLIDINNPSIGMHSGMFCSFSLSEDGLVTFNIRCTDDMGVLNVNVVPIQGMLSRPLIEYGTQDRWIVDGNNLTYSVYNVPGDYNDQTKIRYTLTSPVPDSDVLRVRFIITGAMRAQAIFTIYKQS